MRNKFLWIDLAVCSIWLLAILGDRNTWNSGVHFIAILTAAMRLTFTFSIVKGEKRAWIPLVGMITLTALMLQDFQLIGIDNMASYVFPVLNIKRDVVAYKVLVLFNVVWIWLVPPILYFIRLFRKQLIKTDSRWQDMSGCILWNDKKARTYSVLMLACIITFYTGLAMNARACRAVCLVIPTMSYWMICRYYHVKPRKLWLLVVSMVVFYYAQPFAGLWRIVMLSISLVAVIYMAVQFYRATNKHVLSVLIIFYIGIFLPSVAIGYNQYACMDYGRLYYNSHIPYDGVFYIKDFSGEKEGLRDRYGVLVEPEYDGIYYPGGHPGLGGVELRRDGYQVYYDLWTGHIRKDNDIDEYLQSEICRKLNEFVDKRHTDYDDRLEVKVTEIPTSKVLGHVKMAMYGLPSYNYEDTDFLPEDTVGLSSGQSVCDTLVVLKHSQKKMISYAVDLKKDAVPMYRINLKIAKDEMPEVSTAEELANAISQIDFFNFMK